MASAESPVKYLDAVVDGAGNAIIAANQLPDHLPPGSHVQVELHIESASSRPLRGSLPDLPDLAWEDFEDASRSVQEDLAASA